LVLNLKNTFVFDCGCLGELGALVTKFKILTFSPTPWLSVKTFLTLKRRGRENTEKNKSFFFWVLNLKNTFDFDFGCLGGLGALVAKFMILTFSALLR
jgi:hypothetical protein